MRTPIKGKPDFTHTKTEDLITYMNVVQQMIFAYKYESAVITEAMQTVWKDINSELCDRQAEENDKFLRMYFNSNCLYGDENWLQVKPEEISSTVVEEKKPQTVQKVASRVGATPVEAVEVPVERKTISEKVDAVMNKMKDFMFSEARLNEARSESHIGVTTFITKGPKKSVSNQATEFGTSCDTITRIFFSSNGGFNAEQTYRYIYDEYR